MILWFVPLGASCSWECTLQDKFKKKKSLSKKRKISFRLRRSDSHFEWKCYKTYMIGSREALKRFSSSPQSRILPGCWRAGNQSQSVQEPRGSLTFDLILTKSTHVVPSLSCLRYSSALLTISYICRKIVTFLWILIEGEQKEAFSSLQQSVISIAKDIPD